MSEYNNGLNSNEALDWGSEISAESSFTLLPEGEYPFTVISFERSYYNGSEKLPPCPMAILKIEVDGGDKGKSLINHRLFVSRKTEGLLCEFFIALGQKKHGEPLKMNWQLVPGSSGRCKVGIRIYNGNEYNEIKKFLEPEEKAATAPLPGFAPPKFS